ncbi:hypothetical protein NPIL_64981 [Nephila pilipes]|uniref:Uncharacterized protein n=1 Tax=Nephila pilipes TaxID=299642 RepID=A0A8X6Q891_NEPPI|nr:hypothetical protein NPIL_64981 [Nephila pilipes]
MLFASLTPNATTINKTGQKIKLDQQENQVSREREKIRDISYKGWEFEAFRYFSTLDLDELRSHHGLKCLPLTTSTMPSEVVRARPL